MRSESQEIKIRWRCPAGVENLGVYIRGVLSPVSLSCLAGTNCQLKAKRQISVGPASYNLNFRIFGYCQTGKQEVNQNIVVNSLSNEVKPLEWPNH